MSQLTSEFVRCSSIARRGRIGRLIGAPVRFPRSLIRKYHSNTAGPSSHRTHLFWGESMEVLYPEMVSVHVDRYGFFEEGLTAFALQYLQPGMTVCDIGGHFGYFSRLAEFLVRDSGSVHTFEPTPSTFSVLERNTREYDSIHLNQLAVADKPGSLELTDYGTAFAAFNTIAGGKLEIDVEQLGLTPTKTTVETTTIDDYVDKHQLELDFVKLDAEGAEELILAGMQKVLETDRPTISMEVGGCGDQQSARCVSRLLRFGYVIKRYNAVTRLFDTVDIDENDAHDNLFFVHKQNI